MEITTLLSPDSLPAWLLDYYYGVPGWIWLGLPLLYAAALLVSIALGHLIGWATGWFARKHPAVTASIDAVVPPLEALLSVAIFKGGKQFFPLGKRAILYTSNVELFLGTLAVGWLFIRLAQVFSDRLEASFRRRGKRQAEAIIPLLRRLMKGAVAALTILFLLQNMGFNVSAMLAGLGIGGVAIALASQKSVENLFGGVVLVLDQPVRVGDFGQFGQWLGTIEDVGLRSTRIRTLNRTLVTVPNGDFSQMQLESFTERDMLLWKTLLTLVYETTPDQIRDVLARLTRLLESDARVKPGFHIRLTGFGASSLDIELFAYILTPDNDTFLAIREELMLHIMEEVKAAGSDFAFPSQTLYVQSPEDADAITGKTSPTPSSQTLRV